MTTKDDWAGYPVRSALVNYHDHLELNHYPRTRPRDRYANAHDWADDVNASLEREPYRGLRAYTFFEKAFIGALKNLFCGVTTVFQHGAPTALCHVGRAFSFIWQKAQTTAHGANTSA